VLPLSQTGRGTLGESMRSKDVARTCVGHRTAPVALLVVLSTVMPPAKCMAHAGWQTAASKTPLPVGTIKAISGKVLTLATDSGAELNVILPEDVKLLRVAPGSKDLKDAAAIQLSDLKGGDRILVRGKMAEDGKTFTATTVVAMKKEELAEKAAHEKEEWQRHGIGGLVRSVDVPNGAVTIGVVSAAGSKEVAVHTTKSTVVRRYPPDSVKFDDAKTSSLAAVKVGDQLRARNA